MKKIVRVLSIWMIVLSMMLPTYASNIEADNSESTVGFLALDGKPLDPHQEYIDTAFLVLDGIPRKLTEAEYKLVFAEMSQQASIIANEESVFPNNTTPLAVAAYRTEFFIDYEETREHYDLTQKTAVTPQ